MAFHLGARVGGIGAHRIFWRMGQSVVGTEKSGGPRLSSGLATTKAGRPKKGFERTRSS